MAIEIIKTEDPNIIIERTVTDREIHLGDVTSQISGLQSLNSVLLEKLESLQTYSLPQEAQEIINAEIVRIEGEIFSNTQEIERLTLLLG